MRGRADLRSRRIWRSPFAVAIAAGVALLTGVSRGESLLVRSYEEAGRRIAGVSAIRIASGKEGLPAEALDRVRTLPGVRAALGSIRGFARLEPEGERVYLLGVALPEDGIIRDYRIDAEETPAQNVASLFARADAAAFTSGFLSRRGREIGERVRLAHGDREIEVVIEAALDPRIGPASLFDGAVAVVRPPIAQRLFGLEGRLREIDIVVEAGADVREVDDGLRSIAGSDGWIEWRGSADPTARLWLAAAALAWTLAAMFLLIVGLGGMLHRTLVVAMIEGRTVSRRGLFGSLVFPCLGLTAVGYAAGITISEPLAQALSPPLIARAHAASDAPVRDGAVTGLEGGGSE